MESALPPNWNHPHFELYDGSTDPDEHLDMYVTQVGLYTSDDALFCRVFPSSLRGDALSWFIRLLPNSVDCFQTLASKFKLQFFTSRPLQLTSSALVNVRQEKSESLRAFMKRFDKMAFKIKDLCPEVALHHLTTGALRPGPFFDSLCIEPTASLEELRRRAAKYIELEEFRFCLKSEHSRSY